MEDPWAASQTWGEPSKADEKASLPISNSPTRSPPRLASDPWGAPTPDHDAKQDDLPTFDWNASPIKTDVKPTSADTPGWGGGWGEEAGAEAGPSRSPIRPPADSPEWSMSRAVDEPPEMVELPGSTFKTPDSPKPASRSSSPAVEAPPSPSGGFDQPSPIPSAISAIPNLDNHDEPALPKSPSFGDDFGGFSSFGNDPWGPRKQDEGWGPGEDSDQASSETPEAVEMQDATEEDDGWGGEHISTTREVPVAQTGMDQDWEEAQRRIRVTEERAPRDTIVKLQEGWKNLVKEVIGENRVVAPLEGEQESYDRALRDREDSTRETLRSLALIPPDTNTYPPVLSSLETHERYRYALARPNPTPETSLLNVPMNNRGRREESLQDSLDSWTSRSRLGEPEAPPVESSVQTEDAKPKWSFWRKNTVEKPLVTSGGGILEAKSMSSPPIIQSEPRKSTSSAAKSSRPASPAPAAIPVITESPVVPPSTLSSDPAAPAQSAVTRFFGRLSRRQSSQPTSDEHDNGDFALSADDFSFLDQVPSIAPQAQNPNVGDLLAFEGGRTESMASLESMLNSKPTPLPAPLAPPPTWSRSSSSTGITHQKPTEMDFLEGLESDNSGGPSANLGQHRASNSQAISSATSSSNWDQLLAPSTQSSAPTSAAPMIPSAAPLRPFTPPITPSALSPTPTLQPFSVSTPPIAGPSYKPAAPQQSSSAGNADFDDFDDFAPAVISKMDDFDDFGDFSDFSTPPPATHAPQYPTPASGEPSLRPPPSTGHIKRASLDHSMTLNLMNSAVNGKRWPAPPSPLAPQLEPPPKAPSASFPFISPPPGGRSSSNTGFGDLLDDPSNTVNASDQPPLPNRAHSPAVASSSPIAPMRTSSPLARPPSSMGPVLDTGSRPPQPAQSGLSAQDLSFFDSL